MSDSFSADIEISNPNMFEDFATKGLGNVKDTLKESAQSVYDASQISVPVGETGDLKASGHVGDLAEDGEEISIEVIYGDGNGTSKTYSYSAHGGVEADGYAWFQELGTKYMDAQAYLYDPFASEASALEDKIKQALGL